MAMVEDHPELRAQRDVTDPRPEADAPDPDQDPEVDQIHGVPTALSSIEKTRYNRKVWLRKPSILIYRSESALSAPK